MKKILLPVVIILVLVAGYFVIQNLNNRIPREYPDDFDFVFEYDFGNRLDTFEDTFSKDMVMDPNIIIPMKLTAEEMNEIYQKMSDINIFNINEPISLVRMTPCTRYYVKVLADSKIREKSWSNCKSKFPSEILEFGSFMKAIIESKPEYQSLPKSRGGYL